MTMLRGLGLQLPQPAFPLRQFPVEFLLAQAGGGFRFSDRLIQLGQPSPGVLDLLLGSGQIRS